MPDDPNPAVTHWVEDLRRIIAERRRTRRRVSIAVLAGCATVPLAASTIWTAPVLLLWNASASAPVGLYRLYAVTPVRRGDMVVARIPETSRSLAARRHYIPANVPVVKRVAAVAGDRLCAVGAAISINGMLVAVRRKSDRAGRPMPWWKGCRGLRAHEYFLLMDSPSSFDGRYFGITRDKDVLGRAELLWAKPAQCSSDG
ncbi:MAG TPA: S26 family signal peptidase [Sphingomicrobium sp.]|nr:S26 family signal peptidase [Sphingomicrobium sp.]